MTRLELMLALLLSHLTVTFMNHTVFEPSTEDETSEANLLKVLGGASNTDWHQLFPVLLGFVEDSSLGDASLKIEKFAARISEEHIGHADFKLQIVVDNAVFGEAELRNVDMTVVGKMHFRPTKGKFVEAQAKLNKGKGVVLFKGKASDSCQWWRTPIHTRQEFGFHT